MGLFHFCNAIFLGILEPFHHRLVLVQLDEWFNEKVKFVIPIRFDTIQNLCRNTSIRLAHVGQRQAENLAHLKGCIKGVLAFNEHFHGLFNIVSAILDGFGNFRIRQFAVNVK